MLVVNLKGGRVKEHKHHGYVDIQHIRTTTISLYGAVWCIGVESVVKLVRTEKIGTTEWITLRRHARVLYLPLSMNLASVFDLKPGDQIKVKLVEIKRADRGEE